ncbi:hypothetical protein [Cytobacillus gottheilii]|uniref:hypothetical protein n=1 Tax=Cytobacillus gottheilii TaxID=859144 RepID=UPI0034643004
MTKKSSRSKNNIYIEESGQLPWWKAGHFVFLNINEGIRDIWCISLRILVRFLHAAPICWSACSMNDGGGVL